MVSSAVYRYFPSRDDLLTALIIDGQNALGSAAGDADAACRRDDEAASWLVACRAVRDWALAHPHEYSLVYGSPVPGYQAPEQTAGPATRVAAVLGKIISDAQVSGVLDPPALCPPPPDSFAPDAGAAAGIRSGGGPRRCGCPGAGGMGGRLRAGQLRAVRPVRERRHRSRRIFRPCRALPGPRDRHSRLTAAARCRSGRPGLFRGAAGGQFFLHRPGFPGPARGGLGGGVG
jgi:AcrR family transcriptional regulator